MAYRQNPKLLDGAEARIKQIFEVAAPVVSDEVNSAGLKRQRGVSLIELIMFIVIVSVAVAGILLVMNVTTRGSADPLIHKQALAIAESLLEEVELMPFTYCDPDDPAAGLDTTVDTTACTVPVGGEAIGPEVGETRYSAATPFDNVNDYAGCQMNTGAVNACDTTGNNGIRDINGNAIGPTTGYSASVVITLTGVTLLPALPDADALLITVTVTGPDGTPVVVEGIRTRYSPRI
ncbi:MAG: prepilin-type N-terminal cleavage/methylation domain-containing protein [Nitrosomonadales bacterium]|nr:prepilin-type N-terminal cleavage/methylation domain-containing protein [Nitrosomonadales bacterium]